MSTVQRLSAILLSVALVVAMGVLWYQHGRLTEAERILGYRWSNEFARVFSHLGEVNQELQRIAAEGEMDEATGANLDQALSYMTSRLTNTLGDVRGYLPDVPQVPYLIGYLDQVWESVNTHRGLNAPRPLSAEEREAFRRYAALSAELTAIVKEHYPDYPGVGPGFTGDDDYWGPAFLTDRRWREMLKRLDAAADEAGFMAR